MTTAPTSTGTGSAAAVRSLVEDLERHLGDPFDPEAAITFARILDLDEAEDYPHELLQTLQAWGAHEYAVPARWGGKAVDIETSLHLMRQVARRDPTLATALSITSLSFMPIWVAGTDEQRTRYVEQVRNGAKLSWGLSERAHGSDVLDNATVARKVPGGYLVSGEKWLIGNCSLADHLVLFARTGAKPGPAAFTLLVLDRRSVPAAAVRTLPNERLHGLRGIDMSGVQLSDAFVPDDCVIGGEGRGLEVFLQASQSVRSMIVSIPLGCTDTALRLALDFAAVRQVFGQKVTELPHSRRQLADAYADLLAADALATAATRALQVAPEQASVFASIAKYLVPTMLESTLGTLAVVLGARHYLRSDPRFGAFQKLVRDAPVANFADGNTVVNLKNVVAQLPALLADEADSQGGDDRRGATFPVVFDLDAALPDFEPWRTSLSARGADDAVRGLARTAARLRERAAAEADPADTEAWGRAADLADRFDGHRARLAAEVAELKARVGAKYAASEEMFHLARQYCVVHAAAAVAGVWAHTDAGAVGLPGPHVLLLALDRLHQRFAPTLRLAGDDAVEAAMRRLLADHASGTSFSVRPAALAAAPLQELPAPRRPGGPASAPAPGAGGSTAVHPSTAHGDAAGDGSVPTPRREEAA